MEFRKRSNIHRIEDLVIPTSDKHSIPIRIYIPNDKPGKTTLVFFHLGGWVFGSVKDADSTCRKLANHLDCTVVSVDYRLAPEFPFPTPLNDCFTATEWVYKNISSYGGAPESIIVSGESAGGNLAAAVAKMALEKNAFPIQSQLLFYPVISSTIDEKIYDNCPDHYFITKEVMSFFWQMYAPNENDRFNPLASLEKDSNFSDLPPTLFILAEYDPMRTDSELYAKLLNEANSSIKIKLFKDVIHGFLSLPLYTEDQKITWIKEIKKELEINR